MPAKKKRTKRTSSSPGKPIEHRVVIKRRRGSARGKSPSISLPVCDVSMKGIDATRIIYWLQAPGSLTDQQTAFDYVVLIMEDRIGDIVGYPGYRTYDDDWNDGSYWQSIGYPGELSSGERPAFQGGGSISSVQNFSLSGQSGSILGHFNDFTPGQSGGPAWGWWGSEPWPRVVGVGSTIGSTAVQAPTGSTNGDNEYGGGSALSVLISWARANYP